MRYRTINKWDTPIESKNLLFFSQLLEELLFDYSLDTYKPSAMNTSLLCEEALEVILEIENGNIKSPNLKHVLDELCENLSKDNVSISLLELDLSEVKSILLNPKIQTNEKKIVVSLVQRQIELLKYKAKNEELLIKSIINSDDLSNIRSLTRSYITTLINIGYSTEFIYKVAQQYFYYGNNRISGNVAIHDFISLFVEEKTEYKIVYRGSKLFKLIEKSCHRFNIEILSSLVGFAPDIDRIKFTVNDGEVYLCLNKIEARDIKSAKDKADEKLELIGTLYALFHHKEPPKFQSDCLVINEAKGTVERSRNSINSMHKCVDLRKREASSKMNRFVLEFRLENISFRKFTRSAELHSLALNSESKENQMINLWIALESIIPSSIDGKTSNIVHIIDSTMPFLNVVYFQRLIARFCKDLINWNKRLIYSVIHDISGVGIVQKVIKLIALPEYADQQNRLREEFRDFHLMADRFEYFCYIFTCPKNLLAALEGHTKRVKWQIRRIYRARNLIVHSGKTPSYVEILIENIHDYLDIIMNTLMRLATMPKTIVSIEQGFKYINLTYASYSKELSSKGAVFNAENLGRIFDKDKI